MHVDVNGTRLWFDVEGPSVVPDGASMRERATVILVHGGPASYDHSYFKPHFERLAREAQMVYLDLRDHGRSGRHDPAEWNFETCADDLRAFCDELGIERPLVLGHSMGGFVAMLYGARHPGHACGLVLQSTLVRFDLDRVTESFRHFGGDEVAELARRSYAGDEVSTEQWARVFACFGPNVPDADTLARRVANPELGRHGLHLLRTFDALDRLDEVACPVLVCVGELDPITPVTAARELVDALPSGRARLEILPGAGHFPWLDVPDRYWPLLLEFVSSADAGRGSRP